MATEDTIKKGIELYTGSVVASLVVFADPKVEGAYAIRAMVHRVSHNRRTGAKRVNKKATQHDFLLSAHWLGRSRTLTPELVDEYLEDTIYDVWPPKVGNPRFFV